MLILMIALTTMILTLRSPAEVQASIVLLPEEGALELLAMNQDSQLQENQTMQAGTTRRLAVVGRNVEEASNWRIIAGATSGSSTTINETTGVITIGPGQTGTRITVSAETATQTITEDITVTPMSLTITNTEEIVGGQTRALGLSQAVSNVHWSVINGAEGTTINEATGQLTVGSGQSGELTILATVDGRTITSNMMSIPLIPKIAHERFQDPETGAWWRVLVPNDGNGNALIITEHVHMTSHREHLDHFSFLNVATDTRYHTNIGFTYFQDTQARQNIINWFNYTGPNAVVGPTIRSMALDYEFANGSKYTNPVVVGVGIENDRVPGSHNGEAAGSNAGGVVGITVNLDRAITRPLPYGTGTPEPFVLSVSEANRFFGGASAPTGSETLANRLTQVANMCLISLLRTVLVPRHSGGCVHRVVPLLKARQVAMHMSASMEPSAIQM